MKKIYKTLLILLLLLSTGSYFANLQAQMYSLNTSSSPSSGGYASPGGGMYYAGQNVTVTAIAVNGYTFAGWSGSVSSWSNPVTVTMNSNKTLIANFVILYNLTLNTSPSNGGYVNGAGTGQFQGGQPITVMAVPFSGYRFVSWTGSVNSTSNPMTFTMSSNMTITANFELIPVEAKISSGPSHSLLLKSDGTLWAWGDNSCGQLGIGSTLHSYYPTQIQSGTTWKDISTWGNLYMGTNPSFSIAIRSDGTMWGWGSSSSGQFGNGQQGGYSTIPVRIGYDSNWAKVAVGYGHCLAIKTDGSLYSWGLNYSGELGNGSQVENDLPARIGTDNDWINIYAGNDHSCAIKADGTLWAWGSNNFGILGLTDQDIFYYLQPTKVGNDNDWKQVSYSIQHTLAIKKDATLWAWGDNSFGELGDPTLGSFRWGPVQIGTDKDWKYVSSSENQSMGLKTNGNVYGWGINDFGEIGDGSTEEKQTPTLAIGISNKILISSGENFALTYGSDNYICGSGYNYYGQFGDGTRDNRITFNCVSFPTSLKSAPSISSAQESTIIDPSKSTLFQNYPNPTQGAATIDYYLADDAVNAKIVLYNFTGSVVKEYPVYDKGKSSIPIDISNLPSGIYSYGLVVNGSNVDVKKLLLTK